MCRSITWAHTTPLLLFALSIMSELSQKEIWIVLALDVVMQMSGLAYDLSSGIN